MTRIRPFLLRLVRSAARYTGFAVLLLFTCCASAQRDELGPELRNLLGIDETLSESPKEDLEKTFDANTLIRQAENHYAKEEYETALTEYKRFVDLHPIDRLVNLAKFRMALCYYHQVRTVDRDVEPMQNALSAFENLVKESPQSLYAEKSQTYIAELKSKLAEREFYIAYFYFRKGSYSAAVARLENLVKEYPDSTRREDALFYLGSAYGKLGNDEKERTTFNELLARHPDSPYREEIGRLLSNLSA